MNSRLLLVALLLMLGLAGRAAAQTAISYDELAERLDPYFAPELLQDVKDALPQSGFDIWGYDVGDFSGDGANDLAVAIRLKGDRGRKITTYFFVDDQGILRLIKQGSYEFVELPVEVGVSIFKGNFYVTHKLKEFQWEIYGYTYRDGVVMMVDRFTTDRQGTLTYENYRNYQSMEGYERYLNTTDEQEVFRSDFLTTPAYNRGRDISSGYQATTSVHFSKYILRGSYFWKGEEDLSLDSRAAYDDDYLYFNILVHDDQPIPIGVNDIDSTADRIGIWIDTYTLGDRFRVGKRMRDFRTKTDSNIYAFTVSLGDFVDLPAKVKVSTSNVLDDVQSNAVKNIKAVAIKQDSGYVVKVRIPFQFLGFEKAPVDDTLLTQFGMSIVAYDVDNPYRPEETTVMATSQKFEASKPATYGSIVLVPRALHYGEAVNIYLTDIRERLEEVGF
jgi:hypothetical protein